MEATHEHYFTYDPIRRLYVCRCGAIVSSKELARRYGQVGNQDFDPKQASKIFVRRKDAHKKRTD